MKANYMTILGPSTMRLVACLVAFPLIIMLSMNYQDQMFNLIGEVKVLGGKALNVTQIGSEPKREPASISSDNILLDGLLSSGFDQESCLSRFESVLYRKPSPKKPSPYLISKLRNYENLHKRCGPDTELYKTTLKLLDSRNISSPAECNYVVWTAQAGLGNRMLNIASAFLYSLLTNKILLVEFNPDMSDLFCEPFPDTSWLLPRNFPKQFRKFNQWNGDTLGNTLKNNVFNASSDFPLPSHLYIFLAYGLTKFDMLFYCEEHHDLLRKIPWLVFRSDEYFIPSLFLIPSFQQELDRMFPDKETIFHHLGKYLFHPSNKAWGLITRFHDSYLAKSGEIIGMQIRVFNQKDSPVQRVIDQILACTTIQENFLPQVDTQKLIASDPRNKTSKAILIASLYPQFYGHLSKMYWAFPTRNGEVIRVFQPSHEEYQHFGDNMHNVKAWVEMYLLSMSNVLVTSSGSTFGYVAQGLGGLTPWILYRPESWKNSDPACLRGKSIEPCLHIPPSYDCKNKREFDMGTMVPYVKHCEDSSSGLRLINPLQ
ncbi:galactoside 2-alpha-L-fucosyltransferase-like [Mercurialis annua]|uniref:galactoside 2-alpha-L-fucosyltransferase-like n=1 Tax=Mercurialis annua TaxID=3986 RepID=UPI00215DE12A|nr:galactoside 2-alpha-L-fucosyltransferase-like [Mercurialis annua]